MNLLELSVSLKDKAFKGGPVNQGQDTPLLVFIETDQAGRFVVAQVKTKAGKMLIGDYRFSRKVPRTGSWIPDRNRADRWEKFQRENTYKFFTESGFKVLGLLSYQRQRARGREFKNEELNKI